MLRKLGRNNPIRLIYKNYLRCKGQTKSRSDSQVVIDILIPVLEKDLVTLFSVVFCARKYINNPIGNIVIVGRTGLTEEFCKLHNCIFLDEDLVLPIKKTDILHNNVVWYRSGWIFQQLIKLSADELVQNENVLILDADTCLTMKQSFILDDNKIILNFSDEFHFPYKHYVDILNLKKRFLLSFICHHMLFNKIILKRIKKEIELNTGKNWIDAILTNIDFNVTSSFSEYEMYGNYIYYNYPERVHLEYWSNKSLQTNVLNIERIEGYKDKYKSISFHK